MPPLADRDGTSPGATDQGTSRATHLAEFRQKGLRIALGLRMRDPAGLPGAPPQLPLGILATARTGFRFPGVRPAGPQRQLGTLIPSRARR